MKLTSFERMGIFLLYGGGEQRPAVQSSHSRVVRALDLNDVQYVGSPVLRSDLPLYYSKKKRKNETSVYDQREVPSTF